MRVRGTDAGVRCADSHVRRTDPYTGCALARGPEHGHLTHRGVEPPVDNPRDRPTCSQPNSDLTPRITRSLVPRRISCEQVVIPPLKTGPGATAPHVLTRRVTRHRPLSYMCSASPYSGR